MLQTISNLIDGHGYDEMNGFIWMMNAWDVMCFVAKEI